MHHEQRRLVRHARLALDLKRADALLSATRSPEREAPRVHGDFAAVHDRVHLHGELLVARVAEPEIALKKSFDYLASL